MADPDEDRQERPHIGGPLTKEIHTRLKNLCTFGVIQHRVRDHGGALLQLQCVVERASAHAESEDPEVAALVEILREIVDGYRKHSDGKVLWIVLALEDQYLDLSAKERQTLAGREFRGGRNQVTYGAIRKNHLPNAVRWLAEQLMARERESLGRAR